MNVTSNRVDRIHRSLMSSLPKAGGGGLLSVSPLCSLYYRLYFPYLHVHHSNAYCSVNHSRWFASHRVCPSPISLIVLVPSRASPTLFCAQALPLPMPSVPPPLLRALCLYSKSLVSRLPTGWTLLETHRSVGRAFGCCVT